MRKIPLVFKLIRESHSLTQVEFAKKLNVTQGTVSKVEAGSMKPDLELWYKLVTVFKVKNPFCFEDEKISFKSNKSKIAIVARVKKVENEVRG